MSEKITWTTEKRKLGELVKWEENPRGLTREEAERLKDSLASFGYSQLVEIEPDNTIIDGHQRDDLMLILPEYGADFELEVRVTSRKLTRQERKKYIAYKHKGANGHFEWDAMANLYEPEELEAWGWTGEELAELGITVDEPEPKEDAGAQVDKAEELREKWQVEPGQLWQLGKHRLICGDCTDKATMARVIGGDPHVLMTDPPYGIDAAHMTMGSHESSIPREARLSNVENWDDSPVDITPFVEAAKYACVWGGQYLALALPVSDDWLCWDKKNPNLSFSEFELAWTNFGTRCRLLSHHWGAEKKQHITQKPLPVIEWALSLCPEKNMIVFDPFVGSGTTIIASERAGRECRAIERDPKYIAVTLERYLDTTGDTPRLIDS